MQKMMKVRGYTVLFRTQAQLQIESPIELPEDPISQLSTPPEPSHPLKSSKKSSRRSDRSSRRGKCFGVINTSDFRMPKICAAAAQSRQGTPSHSEGFEGHEAKPIGRTMPMKKQSRHKLTFQKLPIRLGELKLVPERTEYQASASARDLSRNPRRKKAKPQKQKVAPAEAEQLDDGDAMLVELEEEQPLGEEVQAMDEAPVANWANLTPQMPIQEESPPQAPTRSSPLQQKEKRNRKISSAIEAPVASQSSQATSTQSNDPFRRLESNDFTVSQRLKMVSASAAGAKVENPRPREIPVDQQLMMVSVSRSLIKHSDWDTEDDDSGKEGIIPDRESGTDTESSEDEAFDTPEEDSADENEIMSDEEIDPDYEEGGMEPSDEHVEQPAPVRATNGFDIQSPPNLELDIHLPQTGARNQRTEDAQHFLLAVHEESEESEDVDMDMEECHEEDVNSNASGASNSSAFQTIEEDTQPFCEEETIPEDKVSLSNSSSDSTFQPLQESESQTQQHQEEDEGPEHVEAAFQSRTSGNSNFFTAHGNELEIPETQAPDPTSPRDVAQSSIQHMVPPASTNQAEMECSEQLTRRSVQSSAEEVLSPMSPSVIPKSRRRHSERAPKTQRRQAPSRRSTRITSQQPTQEEDRLLPNGFDKREVVKPQHLRKSRIKRSVPSRVDDDEDSWRPREPLTSSNVMEVEDDDIVDPPSPVVNGTTASQRKRARSRQLSTAASQTLNLVNSRSFSPPQEHLAMILDTKVSTEPEDLHESPLLVFNHRKELSLINAESYGSVEVGDSQRLPRHLSRSCVPETQFDRPSNNSAEQDEQSDIPTSQATYVPPSSTCFQRASEDLEASFRKPNLARSKSMAASMHTPRRPDNDGEMMAGGITMTAAFQHNISPIRSSGRMPTLMSSASSSRKEKSLKVLTRQASMGLGTISAHKGRRIMSLPFKPPFKNDWAGV
jgi:hypothetical protein